MKNRQNDEQDGENNYGEEEEDNEEGMGDVDIEANGAVDANSDDDTEATEEESKEK
jgi:hypothetical protein